MILAGWGHLSSSGPAAASIAAALERPGGLGQNRADPRRSVRMADTRASGVSIAYDLSAQESFAARHPWLQVERLAADTHFPVLEVL
jgi:hypothetical protein